MSDAIRLGQAAERLLGDDLVRDLFSSLKAKYQAAWEAAPSPDAKEAVLAWHQIQTLADFQQELRRLRDSGTRASRTA